MKLLVWFVSGITLGYMGSALFIIRSMERTTDSLIIFGAICIIWVLLMIERFSDTMRVE